MYTVWSEYVEKVAIFPIYEGTAKVTFGRMLEIADILSEQLLNVGIGRASRIAVLAPHKPETIVLNLLLAYLGYTAVLIDVSLPKEEQVALILNAEVSCIFSSGEVLQNIDKDMFGLITQYEIQDDYTYFPVNVARMSQVDAEALDEDIIAILYSSGTTGSVKGVKITYNSIMWAHKYMLQYTNLNSQATFMDVLPSSHIAGYSSAMSCALTGTELGFIKEVNAQNLAEGFLLYNPTNFIMIPKVYEVMMNKIQEAIKKKPMLVRGYAWVAISLSTIVRKTTGVKLRFLTKPIWKAAFGHNMRICGCGTAPCSKELIEFYLNLGIDFVNVYGSTETGFPICAANCNDKYPTAGVGKAEQFSEVQVIIDSPDALGVGEIRVKTPLIMKGYFKDEELTKEAFDSNGYFKTGDSGYIDRKGNLYVTGRIKENILLKNGKKISPADIDEYYMSKLSKVDIACRGVAVENGQYDEPHLFVATEDEEILQQLKILSNAAPDVYRLCGIHSVETIPKTSVGKVKRYCLELPDKERYEKQGIEVAAGNVREMLYRCICDVRNYHLDNIHEDKKLQADLGFDSLALFELTVQLENITGIRLAERMQEDVSVGDLVDYLEHPDTGVGKSMDMRKFPLPKKKKHIAFIDKFMRISRSIWKFRVNGEDNIPQGEKVIFCPNHESFFDALWVASALRASGYRVDNITCLAAKHMLQKALMKKAFIALGGIPVDRTGNTAPAMERAVAYLKEYKGYMIIHPEGTRSRSGQLGAFKSGAVKIACATGTPIVPVCINGAHEIYPPERKLPRLFCFKKLQKYEIEVAFGQAITPESGTIEDITEQIRNQIVEMKKK